MYDNDGSEGGDSIPVDSSRLGWVRIIRSCIATTSKIGPSGSPVANTNESLGTASHSSAKPVVKEWSRASIPSRPVRKSGFANVNTRSSTRQQGPY